MKQSSRIVIIIGAVILALILCAGIGLWYITSLVTADNIADKYTLAEREDGFLSTVFKGAVFGDEFELSEAMVNTYIYDKYCTPYMENGSGIENVCVYFHDGGEMEIYSRIFRRGHEYAISARATVVSTGDGGDFDLMISDLRIGELAVSEDNLKWLLPRLIESTRLYTVTENRISVSMRYEYEIKNTSIELYLASFDPQEGSVLCRTNSLTNEALRAAKDYILSDEFREDLGDAFDRIKDGLKGLFG